MKELPAKWLKQKIPCRNALTLLGHLSNSFHVREETPGSIFPVVLVLLNYPLAKRPTTFSPPHGGDKLHLSTLKPFPWTVPLWVGVCPVQLVQHRPCIGIFPTRVPWTLGCPPPCRGLSSCHTYSSCEDAHPRCKCQAQTTRLILEKATPGLSQRRCWKFLELKVAGVASAMTRGCNYTSF